MAVKRVRIDGPILTVTQHGQTCYNFVLSARRLLEIGRVERFQEGQGGVQREAHEGHIVDLADCFTDPDALFLESIVVFLASDSGGKWKFSNGNLYGPAGSFLSVDNGQHRLEALRLLAEQHPEVLDALEFIVTAMPFDMSFAQRVRLFLQQDENKPVDRRLQLAQRHAVGLWPSELHEVAYKICMALHGDNDSPLQNGLNMHDTGSRPYERGGNQKIGINVKGVFNTFLRVLGPQSPLSQLTVEQQIKVSKTFLRIAAEEIWPNAWGRSTHVLSTAKGIEVLFLLFTTSPHFKAALGKNFKEENLRRILLSVKPFVWTRARLVNLRVPGVVDRLDEMISRNLVDNEVAPEVD